jgi:tRNA(Arg) A34 adenosine deaminase TadA
MAINKFLAKAMEQAKSSQGRYRHGAVLVKDGTIVGSGCNQMRGQASITATTNSWRASFLHAEEIAISQAGTAANGAVLYVARISKAGDPKPSAPCVRCSGRLRRAGVLRVVYT